MGAKDWFVVYADGDVRPTLQKALPPDRAEARAVVARLYPDHDITEIADGTLDCANPPDDEVYIGCFEGLTIVATVDVAVEKPSTLSERFLHEARGRTTYLHAMHSVVDWCAFAVWSPDGTLRRAVSLWPESGIIENTGDPFDFEAPYWAGERPVDDEDDIDEDDAYPLPFHPLEFAEEALRSFFGFNYEGDYYDDDPHLENVVLVGFRVTPR